MAKDRPGGSPFDGLDFNDPEQLMAFFAAFQGGDSWTPHTASEDPDDSGLLAAATGSPILSVPGGMQGLDDRTLLELMASPFSENDNGGPTTFATVGHGLQALVSEKLLEMTWIKDGPELVRAIVAIIARYMRFAVSFREGECGKEEQVGSSPFQSATLAKLADWVENDPRHVGRMRTGVELGDRSVHLAAGWVGSRGLVKVMGPDERRRYG
ncbi:MAG: hypothetical protein Q8P27_00995 [Candidatus Peregrinibacteria bacterium]|nr:hypothetical protein [Candidatus Peregrinibacteria bacterium]